jgi:FkbM family methyltransferase
VLFPPERFQGPGRLELTVDYDSDLRFRCDLSSYIEWSVFFLGQYGHPTARVIKSLLNAGNRAIDVGANVGAYTLIMAKAVGRAGRVAAFDANPEVYQRLVQNLALNDFLSRSETYSFALSSLTGTQRLHLPDKASWNRGTATLIGQARAGESAIEVGVETLDRAVGQWERCDLIKIDTDGSDFAVLEGATEIIERFRPSLIFEFDQDLWPNAESNRKKVAHELERLGYSFFFIDQRWGRIREIGFAAFPKGNILALPASRRMALS